MSPESQGPPRSVQPSVLEQLATAGRQRSIFSFNDALDVGMANRDPVVDDYATPRGQFTGTICTVEIDNNPDVHHDAELVTRARFC